MKTVLIVAVALFALSGSGQGTELCPPEVGLGWTNGWVAAWARDVPGLQVSDSVVRESADRIRVVRRWTWTGDRPLEKVTLGVRYHVAGDATALKPFIPGILLYGNPSNAGRTDGRVPVYSGAEGEFAFFEEHRLPMPFALLENAGNGDFAALHVLPSPVRGAVRDDLWWSLGVEARGDGADIVMMSGPVGYNSRRSVVKALQRGPLPYDETYLTLQPGQVVEKTFWIQRGKASVEAFGFEQALDVSLEIFKPCSAVDCEDYDVIVRSKRNYAVTRWMEGPAEGACGFNMYAPEMKRRRLTLGWCGCAATCGYALPVLDFDSADWEKAQRSLDFISEELAAAAARPSGLFPVTIDMSSRRTSQGDPVSCGQGLYSVLKAIRFARTCGGRLDPTKWERFAEGAATNIAQAVLKPDWREPKSAGDGFLIAPLVLASELFGRDECLQAARRLAAALSGRYFGYDHVYWGGSLDASCEDKEGAFAAFQGYAALLRRAIRDGDRDSERRYARLARHAMNLMLTYTMVWNATYPPGRLSDHAFKSAGWTVVSAQNQHLDAFGVLTTPEIWRMGDYLGDERLRKLARLMYCSCYQLTNAAGEQGEQIQQTNFAQSGDMSDVTKLRGGYAERWTVFWLTAHFLNAAAEFKEMGVSLSGERGG